MGYNDTLKFEREYKNGKGREYYDGILKFNGKYKNRIKNGKTKEFFNNKITFEGEYLNEKKWIGKRYDNNNNIICEIKNGSGYIKEFFGFDELIFENEYFNGERNGKGKEYH